MSLTPWKTEYRAQLLDPFIGMVSRKWPDWTGRFLVEAKYYPTESEQEYVVLKRHAWNDYSEILYTMQEPQMPDRDLAVEFPTLKDALDHLNDTYQLFMATVNIWETSVSKPKEYRVPTKLLDNE